MQKPLKPAAGKKKQGASNRHGKIVKTKKGRLDKAPKRATLKRDHEENKKITQAINEENEQQFAGVAAATGGKLAVLRPPIAATADQKQKTA